MAVLTFTESGGVYVAEFAADKDFNIHIERASAGGVVQIHQRTGEADGATDFALTKEFPLDMRYSKTIDCSFTDVVYPKTIRVVSETAPSFACVTFAS